MVIDGFGRIIVFSIELVEIVDGPRVSKNVAIFNSLICNTLQIGQQIETVNVLANSELTESQSSSLAQVVGHKYIDNLPLPNRSANSLVNLSPGVVMIDPGQGAENYPIFSVAGGRARNQNFTLDGGSIGNAVGLARPSQMASLPLDALEEFPS